MVNFSQNIVIRFLLKVTHGFENSPKVKCSHIILDDDNSGELDIEDFAKDSILKSIFEN